MKKKKEIAKIWIGTFHKRYTNSPRWLLPEGTPSLFSFFFSWKLFLFFHVPECSVFGVLSTPEWNCILLFQVAIRISRKDLSSVSGEYSKKIPEKSFDIFGTIKTIGLRERIHSHDQSKREAFSRTVSYKEEIHFIIRSKLYRLPYVFLKRNKTKQNDYKKRSKDHPAGA